MVKEIFYLLIYSSQATRVDTKIKNGHTLPSTGSLQKDNVKSPIVSMHRYKT